MEVFSFSFPPGHWLKKDLQIWHQVVWSSVFQFFMCVCRGGDLLLYLWVGFVRKYWTPATSPSCMPSLCQTGHERSSHDILALMNLIVQQERTQKSQRIIHLLERKKPPALWEFLTRKHEEVTFKLRPTEYNFASNKKIRWGFQAGGIACAEAVTVPKLQFRRASEAAVWLWMVS